MAKRIIFLLGTGVWSRANDRWEREAPGDGAVSRLAEMLSAPSRDAPIVVYEPDGLAHQQVETPRAGRRVFASLERVRSEYPVVESESLGWGIEPPEPGAGGTFATLLHFELTPGLSRVRDACLAGGSRLGAAFSLFTVAMASAKPSRPATALILLPGFVAVAQSGGQRRSMRVWSANPSDRDWKAVASLVGEAGLRPQQSKAEVEVRRGGVTVVAEGDPGAVCPFWAELRDSGRVGAVVGLDALAETAASLSPRHPANLAEAFPEARDLDPALFLVGAAGFIVTLAAGVSLLALGRTVERQAQEDDAAEAALESRARALEGNRAEMERLREEAPNGLGAVAPRRHPALTALSSAFPESLLLTSVVISEDGSFELEATAAGADFDADAARRAFSRAGFAPAPGGWSFDKAAGRLAVRGGLGEVVP